jgi:hypothetical protein
MTAVDVPARRSVTQITQSLRVQDYTFICSRSRSQGVVVGNSIWRGYLRNPREFDRWLKGKCRPRFDLGDRKVGNGLGGPQLFGTARRSDRTLECHGVEMSAPAAPEKNPDPPARQSAAAEDIIYISICSGGAMIKISAAERPKFVLGQLIIFGIAIFVVTLVELTLWLAN